MENRTHFLNFYVQKTKQNFRGDWSSFFILLALLSIPLSHIVNSICLFLLFIASILTYKKEKVKYSSFIIYPIALYLLMLFSYCWSIDKSLTIPALSKELPLLIIPICFLLIGDISKEKKEFILKYYSYGIFLYAVFYLFKALFRFSIIHDTKVFFYHELVTKDVNAIHVSIYMALSFFYFFTKPIKNIFDYIAIPILALIVFLLSSINIIVAFIGLIIVYYLFYTKLSKQMRMRNLFVLIVFVFSLGFIGKIKDKLNQEYETIMTDSTINDVVSKENNTFYNVSIKQAWTNKTFNSNDFFPGTAFRVYQFRIFIEMMNEDPIFWKGYGLNASYPKIEAKGLAYHVYLGDSFSEGYQKKNFHNQYIQNFAELGIFGIIILILMLVVTIKKAILSKDFVHFVFVFLIISLFLTESFLWRQRGVVFFSIMYCLFNIGVVKHYYKVE